MSTQNLREKTKEIDVADELMAKLNLEVGSLNFPKKTPSGLTGGGQHVKIKANLFPVKIKKSIDIYRREISQGQLEFVAIENREPSHPYDLLGVVRQAYLRLQRAEMNRKLLDLAIRHAPNHNINPARVYYDGVHTLYSIDKLPESTIHLMADNSRDPQTFFSVNRRAARVTFILSSVDTFISLGDIPEYDEAVANADATTFFRPLQQFIETATTEHALSTGRYFANKAGTCYLMDEEGLLIEDSQELPAGTYFARGAQKTARVVEGKNGKGAQILLAVKSVATPFHTVQTIAEKVIENYPDVHQFQNGQFAEIITMLAKVFFYPVHRPNVCRPMEVHGISSTNAFEEMIKHDDGQEESINDYFLRKYRITVLHPELPLIMVKGRRNREGGRQEQGPDRFEYYPMSLCEIAPNQALRGGYSKLLIDDILGANCVMPAAFENNALQAIQSLEFNNSPKLQAAGISVETDELTHVDARVLQAPKIVFNRGNSHYKIDSASWSPGNFIESSNIERWAIWVAERPIRGPAARTIDLRMLESFVKKFVVEARRRGINIGEVSDSRILDIPVNGGSEFDALKTAFDQARTGNCQFILLLTDFEDKIVHGILKKFERQTQIVTQNVTTDTVSKFMEEGGNLETINNVIQKTNEKCGGSNYQIELFGSSDKLGKDDLFVGIATNQLTGEVRKDDGSDQPSVIGYAANDHQSPIKFTGDYIFAKPFRNEVISVVKPILEKVLERFNRNRGYYPKRVFLYLNGMSEGSYTDLLKYVIPIARNTVQLKCNAILAVINGTKLHNVRLIPSNIPSTATKAREQNVNPGTVVDSDIVSPLYDEFYLVSHAGNLGTARPPRFSIVCNDGKLTRGVIQDITFNLALALQIINKSISLPAPLHIALEMAKRGRLNLSTFSQSSGPTMNAQDPRELHERLNDQLPYSDRALRNTRFNA